MGVVINFPNRQNPSFSLSGADEFLSECQKVLCEDDYADLVDAINDIRFLPQTDPDIQLLVQLFTESQCS